jgi:tyrosinase
VNVFSPQLRLALNGSFTIYYFLGPFENEASQYMAQPTLAGLSHNFTAPVELCDNCGRQDQQALLVADTAPITPMLQDYVKLGQLQNLTPEHVRPFLVKNLKWRITTVSIENFFCDL